LQGATPPELLDVQDTNTVLANVEGLLFRTAETLEEYLDMDTLDDRLTVLLMALLNRRLRAAQVPAAAALLLGPAPQVAGANMLPPVWLKMDILGERCALALLAILDPATS